MAKTSARLFDDLDSRGLLDAGRSAERINGYSDRDLEELGESHSNWAKQSVSDFLAEVASSKGFTLFPNSVARSTDQLGWLSRAALYCDTVILSDGLGLLAPSRVHFTVDDKRSHLRREIRRLQALYPLVQDGFVAVLPDGVYETVPRAEVERTVSQTLGREDVKRVIESHTRVTRYDERRIEVKVERFSAMQVVVPSDHAIQVLPSVGEVGTAIPWETASADPALHDLQSSVSSSLVGGLAMDQALCRLVGAGYLCNRGVDWELLTIDKRGAKASPDGKSLSALLEMDLPFLELLTPDQIVKARAKSPESFENFRSQLKAAFATVSAPLGTPDFSEQVAEIQTTVIDPAIAQLAVDAKQLRRDLRGGLALDIPMVVATSAMALFAPGIGHVAGSLMGSLTVYDAVKRVREALKAERGLETQPYHFLFSLNKV